MQVLVAHPDAGLRTQVRSALEARGHRVLESDTGEHALALCRAEGPDVALVEEGLRAGASTLLDAIKRDVDLFRTAVVIVGAELELEPILTAMRRGAQDVLPAPIRPAELIARVQSAERTKVLQEELTAQSLRLESLIFGDELTGLPNRRFLLTQLSALVSGARRHDRPLSVAMLDVDHFKRVNDTRGHAAGDAVIAAVGTTLRDRLREEDWVGRLGGEEFLALLPDDDADGAATVAETLRSTIEHMGVRDGDATLRVTVSVGWATLEDGEDAEALLRRADEALYAAKAAGRNATRGAASLPRRP